MCSSDLLKVREYELYSGYYCGVCKSLGRRYGQIPRMPNNFFTSSTSLIVILYHFDYCNLFFSVGLSEHAMAVIIGDLQVTIRIIVQREAGLRLAFGKMPDAGVMFGLFAHFVKLKHVLQDGFVLANKDLADAFDNRTVFARMIMVNNPKIGRAHV